MAGQHDVMQHWSIPPDPHMRMVKSQVEEELLIKLGAKKEVIEMHPLILTSRPQRSKTFVTLKYSRSTPPATEVPSRNHSPWISADQALRQMSNFSRRGPRDFILPNLVKPACPANTLVVPAIDEDYFVRREAAQLRLSQLLGEWSVYESLAYQRPSSRAASPSDQTHLDRSTSQAFIDNVARRSIRPASSDSFASSSSRGSKGKAKAKALRPVPKSRKTKNRWQEMAGEALLHIKASRMRLPADMPRSELRIYVSSTPDLREEREFLEEVAYPKLREFSEKLGLNCHVVDMRNGAGILDNSLHTFDLIEKELKTCRALSIGPYFVSLLGHKSSEAGLPGFFPKDVYELLRETLVKENILGVDAFDEVYRLDSNRVPPVYIKQNIRVLEEYQSPEQVEKTLLNALKKAVRIIRRSGDDHPGVDFYRWSALVKEHEAGLLSSFSPLTDSLCFMMDAQEAEKDPGNQAKPILRLRHAVFRHFRRFSGSVNLVNFKSGRKTVAYLRSMSDTFLAGVAALLKAQIRHRDYSITQQLTEGSEALQHVRLALVSARDSLDNTDALDQIKKMLDTECAIALLGPSSTGKSTIAHQVARASVLWEPRRRVVIRCLGSSLRSSSLYRALESLINQLGVIYNCRVELPEDFLLHQVVTSFCDLLQSVSESSTIAGGLLVILDQLERLPDIETRFLTCILDNIPASITILLTCRSQGDLGNVLQSHPCVKTVYRTFMNRKEVSRYVKESLTNVNRVITGDQYKTALDALASEPTPVYPEMLYHITRWWPSATLPDIPSMAGDPEKDFAALINAVESGLGKAFSRYALSLLAATRYGLADQELLHLLSKDSDLLNEIEEEANEHVSFVEGFPYQLQLSSLVERLGFFLSHIKIEGESVYQLTSEPLRAAITQRYMSGEFFYTTHQRLANFFQFIRRGLLLSSKDISENKHRQLSKYHWRTLRCVPYHLCHSSSDTGLIWEQLKKRVFFNFTWLVNAVYSGFLPELLDDLTYALETVSLDPDIQHLQQLLIQARYTITHNPLSMAAVFSSQNPEDRDRVVRDNVRVLIHEARQWLTQVHLQALVPVTYTCDKSPRLLVKENSLFGLTSVNLLAERDFCSHGRLLLQRGSVLTILNILTREEIPLVTLYTDVLEVRVIGSELVMVMATGISSKYSVEVIDMKEGKHVSSSALKEDDLQWYHMKSPNAVYFATEKGIKCLDVKNMSAVNILSATKQWQASVMSISKPDKVITVTPEGEKEEIRQMRVKDISSLQSTRVRKEPPNQYCDSLVTTKDGRFIIYIRERLAYVIETLEFSVSSTISHNDLPIVKASLSRSHEHIFLAYANGAVTGHTLLSGLEVLSSKIQSSPRPQKLSVRPRSGRSAEATGGATQAEMVTAIITSEDDHFLLLGSSIGQVYIFHLPTGQQLLDITTGQSTLINLIFLTDQSHFQHLITLDAAGKALHWNLRPLLAEVRRLVQPFIADPDMAKEEQPKLDLSVYYSSFQALHDDRVFLNGPDVAAFYQPLPEALFADLADLDPAFGEQFDWEIKGTVADVSDHLLALVCGHELSDNIFTISNDFRLSRWSLTDGSLIWTRRLPGSDSWKGEHVVHDMELVYWDQAVFVVHACPKETGYGLSVIYTGDGRRKVLSRDQVDSYWMSTDRTQVMLQSSHKGVLSLYRWDLVVASEEGCELASSSYAAFDRSFEPSPSFSTIFSPTLQHCVSVSVAPLQMAVRKPPSADRHKFVSPTVKWISPDLTLGERGAQESSVTFVDQLNPRYHVPGKVDDRHIEADNPSEQDHEAREQTQPDDNNLGNNAPPAPNTYRGINTKLVWTKILGTKSTSTDPGFLSSDDARSAAGSRLSTTSRRNSNRRGSAQCHGTTPTEMIDNSNGVQAIEKLKGLKTSEGPMDQTIPEIQENNVQEESGSPNDMGKETVQVYAETSFPAPVSAACFIGEDILCLGMSTGHVVCLPLPDLEPMWVLGEAGPRVTDSISYNLLMEMAAPHDGSVCHVAPSEDAAMLVTVDRGAVCLWDVLQKKLNLKCFLDQGQEISHLVASKDASIVAVATTDRVLRLWTPLERREVASYMTTFDIVDLRMTPDCHSVMVRGIGKESKSVLEVFELRNVDDILMQVPGRKISREQERRESLVQERARTRSETRRKSQGRRSSVDT